MSTDDKRPGTASVIRLSIWWLIVIIVISYVAYHGATCQVRQIAKDSEEEVQRINDETKKEVERIMADGTAAAKAAREQECSTPGVRVNIYGPGTANMTAGQAVSIGLAMTCPLPRAELEACRVKSDGLLRDLRVLRARMKYQLTRPDICDIRTSYVAVSSLNLSDPDNPNSCRFQILSKELEMSAVETLACESWFPNREAIVQNEKEIAFGLMEQLIKWPGTMPTDFCRVDDCREPTCHLNTRDGAVAGYLELIKGSSDEGNQKQLSHPVLEAAFKRGIRENYTALMAGNLGMYFGLCQWVLHETPPYPLGLAREEYDRLDCASGQFKSKHGSITGRGKVPRRPPLER